MQVYADNAATTRMHQTAIDTMTYHLNHTFGNPSSLYTIGQEAKEVLETARADMAACFGAQPREIYFTSGGSEADNQALRSAAAFGAKKGKRHIISTAFEHHAILHTLDALRKIGARGTYFTVGKQLERYGYVLQKQYDQNHIFGTHTFHHWGGGSFKSDESRLRELALSAEWTLPLVGEEASLFRAPGGTYPSWVETGMPMPIIQWSVDTYDYTGKSPERIFYTFRDKVTEGDTLFIEKLPVEAGDAVTFDQVLAIVDGENTKFGTPVVEGAKVEATVVKNGKGKKVRVYKYKAKKGYHKRQGHRQPYTKVEIGKISV